MINPKPRPKQINEKWCNLPENQNLLNLQLGIKQMSLASS